MTAILNPRVCNRCDPRIVFVFVSLLVWMFLAQGAAAATVTFSAPTNITGDTNVFSLGALRYGYYGAASGTTTVNGVTFQAAGSNLVGNTSNWGTSGDVVVTRNTGTGLVVNTNTSSTLAPYADLNSSYSTLLGASTTGGNQATLTLNNLTVGRVYVAQAWSSRSESANNTTTTWTTGANSAALKVNTTETIGGLGQYFTGNFTADATSQAFTLTCGQATVTTALQVRDVTGYWSGQINASWDDATTNFTGTMAFNAAAMISINRATFADTSGFGTAVTNNNITVQAAGVTIGQVFFENNAVNYSFTNDSGSTGITGSSELILNGAGTVTLSSANTYSGGTTVNSGRLVVNNTSGSGTGSGTVTVSSGAILEGSGTVGGPLVVQAGGTLGGTVTIEGSVIIAGLHSPGYSPGLQQFTDHLLYESGAAFQWDLTANTQDPLQRGVSFDAIDLQATLTFEETVSFSLVFNDAGSAVDWSDPFWQSAHVSTNGWLVYSGATEVIGFENLVLIQEDWLDSEGVAFSTALPESSFALVQIDEDIYLVYIPEPSSLILLLAAMGLALRRPLRSTHPAG